MRVAGPDGGIAQLAGRYLGIRNKGPIPSSEQQVEPASQPAVLQSVIQHHHLGGWVLLGDVFQAPNSIFFHHYRGVWMMACEEYCLIATFPETICGFYYPGARGLPPIAPA